MCDSGITFDDGAGGLEKISYYCGQHVGADDGYYCFANADGCPPGGNQCNSDADCVYPRANPGNTRFYFYKGFGDGGCNSCGGPGSFPSDTCPVPN